eukprot:scaffold151026_cov35-Tisochrysis_lutea.AAC.3
MTRRNLSSSPYGYSKSAGGTSGSARSSSDEKGPTFAPPRRLVTKRVPSAFGPCRPAMMIAGRRERTNSSFETLRGGRPL